MEGITDFDPFNINAKKEKKTKDVGMSAAAFEEMAGGTKVSRDQLSVPIIREFDHDLKPLKVYLEMGGAPNEGIKGVRLIEMIMKNTDEKVAFEGLKLLVKHGLDINEVYIEEGGGHNFTALTLSLRREGTALTETVLEMGGDISIGKGSGTALHHGISWCGNLANLMLLLERGADVNGRDKDGNTPLHLAIIEEKEGLVEMLLSLGADLKIRNDAMKSPLDLANASRSSLKNMVFDAYADEIATKNSMTKRVSAFRRRNVDPSKEKGPSIGDMNNG